MDDHDNANQHSEAILSRRSLARAGLEIASIVVGVLAAMAVSEWQEDRHNFERTRAALQNVQTELVTNLKILETVHSNNARLIEQLVNDATLVEQESEIQLALQISNSAWLTLGATGLGGFVDLDLLATLSQTYSLVDIYRQSSYGLVDANLLVRAAATAAEVDMQRIDDSNLFARNFVGQIQQIDEIESVLIEVHKKAIAALKSR